MRRLLLLLPGLILLLAAGLPATAQGGAVWNAEFFNNAILQGPAVLSRQDTSIAFNWGAGSPASGMNVDEFSARWGTDVFLSAGTYRFWAMADDSVRITIDFQFNPLIDTFNQPHQVGQIVSRDITLNAGMHHIQVDYAELTGNAYVYVDWANLATNPSGPNFPARPPTVPIIPNTWTVEYFPNSNLSASPALIQSEISPTHNWGAGSPLPGIIPADNFSARWSTSQNLAAGSYRITVRADDGVRVLVDGNVVINEWHSATGLVYEATVTLIAGFHTIIVEYYEARGDAFLDYNFAPLGGMTPLTPVPPAAPLGSWTGAYYNNANLSGAPVITVFEGSPSHDWGEGTPAPGIPADNFSVRWTSTQVFQPGTYRITVLADDGVRVFVGSTPVINEWHSASGTPYLASVNLGAGAHNLVVEFYEATGAAFLNFSITPIDGSIAPPGANTGGTLTVNASTLNVRDQPDANAGNIIARIHRDETYSIVGRTADSRWWQINLNGTLGWVFGSFVSTANTANVPVTNTGRGPVNTTGFTVTADTTVVIRSRPDLNSAIFGSFRRGSIAQVVGRSADSAWLQISYNSIVGWVSRRFVTLQPGVFVSQLPVVN